MFADAIASVVNMVSAFHGFSIPNFMCKSLCQTLRLKLDIHTCKCYKICHAFGKTWRKGLLQLLSSLSLTLVPLMKTLLHYSLLRLSLHSHRTFTFATTMSGSLLVLLTLLLCGHSTILLYEHALHSNGYCDVILLHWHTLLSHERTTFFFNWHCSFYINIPLHSSIHVWK